MTGPSKKFRPTDQQRLIRRYARMAEGYQAKIQRQAGSIQRLVDALHEAQAGLVSIDNAHGVKEARAIAKETFDKVAIMLVDHKEDEEHQSDE